MININDKLQIQLNIELHNQFIKQLCNGLRTKLDTQICGKFHSQLYRQFIDVIEHG